MPLPLTIALKRSELDPKNRPLEISATHIDWDGKRIECAAVQDVKYGSIRFTGAGTGLWIADIHELQFRAADDKLRITFSSSFGRKRRDETAERYGHIEDALYEAVTARLVAAMRAEIAAGRPVTVGAATVDSEGVRLRVGLVFKKEHRVAWNEISWRVDGGALFVSSRSDSRVSAKLVLHSTWNAIVLAHVLREMGAAS
jgi:hypothetical protein